MDNYIKEINKFRHFIGVNSLKSGKTIGAIAQALWYLINYYHYRNGVFNKDFICLDDKKLMNELDIGKKTLIKHREMLVNCGLLLYEQQAISQHIGNYRIVEMDKVLLDKGISYDNVSTSIN